ncbi:MAG: DUF998 domain-containing protein [Actinobacteria bacterium]|nr:DUF998 domain-containing protein [Actinomycetota bacterium]
MMGLQKEGPGLDYQRPDPREIEQPKWLTRPILIGPALFGFAILLQSLLRTDVSVLRDFLSEYALGPWGFVQTGAFIAFGLGAIAAAVSLRRATRGLRGQSLTVLLVAIWGTSLVIAAVFETDPQNEPVTTIGKVHVMTGIIGFLSIVAAMLLTAWSMRRRTAWSPLGAVSLATGPVALAAVILVRPTSSWVGIPLRVFVAAVLIWFIALALTLRTRRTPHRTH